MYETLSWEEIIHNLYFLKPECIDKNKILYELEGRFDYNCDVIGKLYYLKAINYEEYIKYMKCVVEREKDKSEYAKYKISLAKKYGDNYNPFSPYLPCGTNYNTGESDVEQNADN